VRIVKQTQGGHLYAVVDTYDPTRVEVYRVIKDTVGFKNFSYSDKKWCFSDLSIYEMLVRKFGDLVQPDNLVQRDYKMYCFTQERKNKNKKVAQEIKTKKESDIEINGIKGELYPFQKLGVEFFQAREGRALLGDMMGCGKTAQTLAYAATEKLQNVLIICPASVRGAWEIETKKWTYYNTKVLLVKEDTQEMNRIVKTKENTVFIISYNGLSMIPDALLKVNWDLIVFDESHYLKNPDAKRTKHAIYLSKRCKKTILLSGTPMMNRPAELFTSLHIIDPEEWPNYRAYTIRYCAAKMSAFGWDVRGSSNISELRDRISPYYLRRTKDEVLSQLPPKIFIDIPIEMTEKERKDYDELKKKKMEAVDKIADEQRRFLAWLGALSALRQESTKVKSQHVTDLVDEIINNDEKVIVFSAYNEPLEKLREHYKNKAVIITGKESNENRVNAVKSFQEDDSVKVFLGGIISAGVGITLTKASNVIFIDYDWTPGNMMQAMDRAHRPGNTAQSINVYQMYVPDTIDEMMKEILFKKQKQFEDLIDFKSKGTTQKVIIKKLADFLKVNS